MKTNISSRLLMVLTLLLGVVSAATAADRFYLDAVNIEPGETRTLAFNLDNSQEFFGFQADITLPDGLEVINKNNKPDCTLSTRANLSFAIVSNQLSPEKIRIGAFSSNHTAIEGTSGALLYLNVHATDEYAGGALNITEILFTNSANNDVKLPDYGVDLGTQHDDRFYIPDFKIAVGETKEISVILDNESSFSAFQTDIFLPEGLIPVDGSIKMTARGNGHSVSSKAFSDGRLRIACLSLDNAVFSGNSGALVTLSVTATKDVAERCTIEMKNQRFSMANAKEYILPNSTTTVTTERALVTDINLSETSLSITTGESRQLSAEVLPVYASTKDVEWGSSNPEVATVNSSGLITALTPGITVITVSAIDGSGVTASCEVTVTGIPVSGITLNRTSGELKVTESLQLSATVMPANAYDKNILWSSSDPTVATVDDTGLVTASAEGNAVITATSVSNPEVTATSSITVIPTPVSSIELSDSEIAIEVGQTSTLEANVLPSTATNKTVTWRSADNSIATVSEDGVITGVSLGTVNVYATAADGSNVTATCIVNVVPTMATGINIDTPESTSFKVGETIQLTATVTPGNATDKSVRWTSSDNSIAKVDTDGLVTAVKEGTVRIKATNSADIEAEIELTVIPTLAESISVIPSEVTLKVGEAFDLQYIISPETTTDKTINWTSSDNNIVAVSDKGNIVAISLGEATIYAGTADGSGLSAECKVSVIPTPATGIKIEYSGKTNLFVGESVKLNAEVTPDDATDKTVIWQTQNAEILTVDNNGNVVATGLGEAWISATNSAGQSSYMTFKVIPTPVSNIELSASVTDIQVGQTTQINAIVSPDNATDKSLSWDSNNGSIASVDQNGLVTGRSVGEVDINARATDGSGVIQAIRINVVPTPVETVSISAEGSTTLKATETLQLSASISPANATDKNVVWSSDNESIATVDQYGTVTAVSVGKATITATVGGKSSTIEITVEKTLAEAIALNRTSAIMKVDGEMQLTVQFTPETTTDKTIKWTSSDTSIASVSENGTIRALQLGECDITATAQDGSDMSATCHIKVEETAAESIAISPKGPFTLHIGETVQLGATVLPATATDKSVTWQSQTAGVSVDEDGLVTALAPVENNWIMATNSAGQTDIVYVTVLPTMVSAIETSKSEVTLRVGKSEKIIATILPSDATDKRVMWSSQNENVAIVSNDGTITALSIGETTVTVKAIDGSDINTVIKVSVVPTPAESIRINEPQSTSFRVGETINLTADVTPDDATDKSITWSSSDESIASVDAIGKVTANGVGRVLIRATNSAGRYDEIELTVVPTLAQSILLSHSETELKVGNKLQLTATVLPFTTTDKTVRWSSADSNIASVDENGNITAKSLGETIITANSTDGSNLNAECLVKVIPTPVESVKIVYDGPTTVKVGFTTQMKAEIYPSDATDKTLTWMGENENIIHVESNGLIEATGLGETRVGVKSANGLTDYINFTVLPNPVEKIEISTEKDKIKVGESTRLIATVLPENATDKALSWDSNDETIATVDHNGVVTGVSVGEVDINARATDGSGVIQAIRISVVATPVESVSITANGTTVLKDGETVQLTASVLPATATNQSVEWHSDDVDIATVENGLVTAHSKPGVAHISAMADNGIKDEIEITVVETPVESVTIGYEGTSATITVGSTLAVTANVMPATATNSNLIWSVSDKTIISYEDGIVTALKPGEAYVIATANNGVSASLLVTVKPILVESVILESGHTIPLYSGDGSKSQLKLEPQIYPANASNKTLHWTSSNETVGMVQDTDNIFYAAGPGTTTLTCHTTDGSDVTATCEVTVIIPLTGISLNEHDITLNESQTFNLVASIEPINATGYQILWDTSDENVAKVENGLVEAISEGAAKITVTGICDNNVSYDDECMVTVKKNTSGIESIFFDDVEIFVKGNEIHIKNLAAGQSAYVHAMNGMLLKRVVSNSEEIIIQMDSNNFYIVSIGNFSLKIAIP